MRLVLLHPDVAARPCSDCRAWLHLDRPGSFAERPLERGGRKVARPAAAPPPCSFCPKQPPDVPEKVRSPATAVEMDDRAWAAYRHYLECRAVGSFPDDPIVRRTAMLVRQAADLAERVYSARLATVRHPGA